VKALYYVGGKKKRGVDILPRLSVEGMGRVTEETWFHGKEKKKRITPKLFLRVYVRKKQPDVKEKKAPKKKVEGTSKEQKGRGNAGFENGRKNPTGEAKSLGYVNKRKNVGKRFRKKDAKSNSGGRNE